MAIVCQALCGCWEVRSLTARHRHDRLRRTEAAAEASPSLHQALISPGNGKSSGLTQTQVPNLTLLN